MEPSPEITAGKIGGALGVVAVDAGEVDAASALALSGIAGGAGAIRLHTLGATAHVVARLAKGSSACDEAFNRPGEVGARP